MDFKEPFIISANILRGVIILFGLSRHSRGAQWELNVVGRVGRPGPRLTRKEDELAFQMM
jgi:hypothetical protein